MKKISAALRSFFDYLREICAGLPEIAEESGYSVVYVAWEFLKCYLLRRMLFGTFRSLKMYDRSSGMVLRYFSLPQCRKISDRLNAGAGAEDIRVMNDKHLFNERFRDFVRREWLYLPESTPEQLRDFLSRNEVFLLKQCQSTQGAGIARFRREEIDPDEFLREHGGEACLVEALIRQHPVLSAVNPSSVNTVRFITARRDDRVLFVGAALRCGGADQFVDNFHHGGAAYPIDLDSGVITERGVDLHGNPILRHPTTGHIMPGLQIPHWDILTEKVRLAALRAAPIGYIGWDVAVTPEGVDIVEGNINYPGSTIIQLDGPGPYERLKRFMKDA